MSINEINSRKIHQVINKQHERFLFDCNMMMKWKPDVSILISLENEFNINSHVYSVKWASTKGKHHFKRLTVTVFMNESKGYQKVQRRNLSGAFEIETFVEWKKDFQRNVQLWHQTTTNFSVFRLISKEHSRLNYDCRCLINWQ